VYRGGSWATDASSLSTTYRGEPPPTLHDIGVGVRCARTP
jgi:formylglycine-generating enzyme required for sulfatase activity